jgi:hypothetical protein
VHAYCVSDRHAVTVTVDFIRAHPQQYTSWHELTNTSINRHRHRDPNVSGDALVLPCTYQLAISQWDFGKGMATETALAIATQSKRLQTGTPSNSAACTGTPSGAGTGTAVRKLIYVFTFD